MGKNADGGGAFLNSALRYDLAPPGAGEFQEEDERLIGAQRDAPFAAGLPLEPPRLPGRWSVSVGAAIITRNVIEEVLTFRIRPATGRDGGGWIYRVNLTYAWRGLEWNVRGRVLHPQLESPVTLIIADERDRSPFLGYNAGIGIRWTDFPWNRHVATTAATALGLSYTERIFAIERIRHPGRDRSHLKLYWPMQITFALPRHPGHQLILFNHHQSGGRIFDRGGMNAVGFGYRHVFPDRR